MRKTIYFGRRDKDIMALFEGIEDKHGEVSDLIKDLVRDGMKYRSLDHTVSNTPMPQMTARVEQKTAEVITLPSKPVRARIGSSVYEGTPKENLERKLDNLL